jgi:hypothetical protein
VSNVDDNPNLRLFVPQHLKHLVITQYHLNNGHPVTQRLLLSVKMILQGLVELLWNVIIRVICYTNFR